MDIRYKARIERTLQYIDDHLGDNIRLRDIADVSHFSEFHFHRIFTGVMGETVNAYVTRRRLERAINRLVFQTDQTITEIALANGFSSSANFSKAVKAYFGFSPSEIRNPQKVTDSKIGKVLSKYGKAFNPSDFYPVRVTNNHIHNANLGVTNMQVDIRDLEEQNVCVLASSGGYEDKAIFAAWDKLIQWAQAQGIADQEQKRFAFCYDNPVVTPVDKCRYEASVVINSNIAVNSPFKKSTIPKGKYAVLHIKGRPEDTLKAQLAMYREWMPDSGFEPDGFPMLERYLNDVRKDGFIELEIYIKLKALT